MSKVKIGLASVALVVGALVAAVGAAVQQLGDQSPTWLATLSAALVAVLGVIRAWQAVQLPGGDGTSDPPV